MALFIENHSKSGGQRRHLSVLRNLFKVILARKSIELFFLNTLNSPFIIAKLNLA